MHVLREPERQEDQEALDQIGDHTFLAANVENGGGQQRGYGGWPATW